MNTWCCDILGHELTIVAPVAESIDGDNDDNSEERGESGPGNPRKLYEQQVLVKRERKVTNDPIKKKEESNFL